MFKLCMIAMIGAAAATCTTTSCTYTDGHTHVFSKMLNDDGTANADHERWHCEKSGTSGCACTCDDALLCTVNHHHTSGYTRSFDHCEAKAAETLEFGMYSFSEHPGGDWNLVDDIAELEDHKNHFIEFYNANDGIPAIKHFTSSNCCWTLRAGKRLYIDGYYSYPHQDSTKCNPSSGYEGKYHFYTSKHSWISTLTTAHTFSEGTNCADNNNPAIYYRGGTISTGCKSTYSPVVSLDSACDYDATSNTWTSHGSASGITMDTSGMVLDSAMGPLFNEGRGRQIDYNVSPSNHEALTYEIWFYVVEKPTGSQCWILGHDNGGYDRSLNLCDSRYGGIGAGNGGTWSSSLGYVEENAWYHIVVTFQNGKTDNKVYVQKVDGALASNSFSANNGDGDQHFSIGGLENYANHHIKAYIPIVRLYDTRLDQTQVEALFDQDKSRFGSR